LRLHHAKLFSSRCRFTARSLEASAPFRRGGTVGAGRILLDTSAWDKITDLLSEHDFYRHEHRLIWRHIGRLTEHAKPIDVITVAESLDSNGELEKAGGLVYLGTLAQNVPSAANIRRYAEIVRERAIMRKLVEVGSEIATSAYNPGGRDAGQLLDEAESRVFEISEQGERGRQGFTPSRRC